MKKEEFGIPSGDQMHTLHALCQPVHILDNQLLSAVPGKVAQIFVPPRCLSMAQVVMADDRDSQAAEIRGKIVINI